MAGTLIIERYVAAGVGRNGTLIASKEDLSVQHGDICHSMGRCYPILPSFCFSFTIPLWLACPIWTVTNKQGEGNGEGEKTAAFINQLILLCGLSSFHTEQMFSMIKTFCLAH